MLLIFRSQPMPNRSVDSMDHAPAFGCTKVNFFLMNAPPRPKTKIRTNDQGARPSTRSKTQDPHRDQHQDQDQTRFQLQTPAPYHHKTKPVFRVLCPVSCGLSLCPVLGVLWPVSCTLAGVPALGGAGVGVGLGVGVGVRRRRGAARCDE